MQRFPCPFCGLRNEREFHFCGEAGKARPETSRVAQGPRPVSDEDWSAYLNAQRNSKGAVREVWMHVTCGELFVLERDSVTMDVTGATALRKDPQ